MQILELIKTRRSIRKYVDRQVPRDTLEQIMEAGSYAPNAGGGQRTLLIALRDRDTTEALGRVNAARMDRSRLAGRYVSADQPSIIDDPSLKSGFYGAPTVCVIFGQRGFVNSVPDAFCCAENIALAAHALGVSSCIVARAVETFDTEIGRASLKAWQIPEEYEPCCFVLLGYCDGAYPAPKPRRAGRCTIIEGGRGA